MTRALYTALLWALFPALWVRLWWRARRQPEYLRNLGERFGRYGPEPGQPLIWVHCVSVGETRAAQPLVSALLERFPDHRILITHMTPTGRATSEQLFGERVLRAYAPYDYPFAVRRFLDHFRPRAGILMETELWPNLIAGCRDRGVPVVLANARLSERSARRYRRVRGLAAEALRGLSLVAAQTPSDAERLAALGATRVESLGNLKFDVVPPELQLATARRMRELWGNRPVVLAASTREGEEALIVEALKARPLPAGALLVIVPRHPQRFDQVASLVGAAGLAIDRRSREDRTDPATQVLLGDSMGEMFAYYAAADVAFVGGSLLPLGGQNLIEACAVGTPVLVGPHTFNFLDATEQAIAAGAALRVENAAHMLEQAGRLLADPAARTAMAEAGRGYASGHRGATARIADRISALLARESEGVPPRATPAAR